MAKEMTKNYEYTNKVGTVRIEVYTCDQTIFREVTDSLSDAHKILCDEYNNALFRPRLQTNDRLRIKDNIFIEETKPE